MCPLPLQAFRGCLPSLACDHITSTSAAVVTSSLTLPLLPSSFPCKDPYDYVTLTWTIQATYLVLRSLLNHTCSVPFTK